MPFPQPILGDRPDPDTHYAGKLEVQYLVNGFLSAAGFYTAESDLTSAQIFSYAGDFATRLAACSSTDWSAIAYRWHKWGVTVPPFAPFETPIEGVLSDSGNRAYKSFTFRLPGLGADPAGVTRTARTWIQWRPGRTGFEDEGRKIVDVTALPAIALLRANLIARAAADEFGRTANWYAQLSTQFNGYYQNRRGS